MSPRMRLRLWKRFHSIADRRLVSVEDEADFYIHDFCTGPCIACDARAGSTYYAYHANRAGISWLRECIDCGAVESQVQS